MLTYELPRLGAAVGHRREGEVVLAKGLRRLIRAPGKSAAEVDFAIWMIMSASHDIIHRAVLEEPQAVAAGRLTEELTRLLVGYLRGS